MGRVVAERCRNRTIEREELIGGTFTVSSVGMAYSTDERQTSDPVSIPEIITKSAMATITQRVNMPSKTVKKNSNARIKILLK